MRKRAQKHRVIVVEDDRTSRALICGILQNAGYDTLECSEGRDALHMAEMNPPRAMVIDVMLPDMQGTRIVEELSLNNDCRFTKCLFLTGILSKKPKDKKYYFDLAGKRYKALAKPIRKSQLLEHLAASVKSSQELELSEKKENARLEEEKEALRLMPPEEDYEEIEGEAISLITGASDQSSF